MRYALVAWMLASGIVAAGPVRAQETPRWRWRAGDTWESRMSREFGVRSERSGGLEPRATFSSELQTWTLRASVRDVDADGAATVEWTVARIQVSAGGTNSFDWDSDRASNGPRSPRPPMDGRFLAPFVGRTLTGVVTPLGELSALRDLDSLRSAMVAAVEPELAPVLEAQVRLLFDQGRARSMLLGDLPPFPERSIDVGDSWTAGLAMPPIGFGQSPLETHATLVDRGAAQAVGTALFRLDAQARIETPARGDPGAGPSFADATGAGSATFSLADGRLLQSVNEVDLVNLMNLPPPVGVTRQVLHNSTRFEIVDTAGTAGTAAPTLLEAPPTGAPVVEERSHPGGVTEWRLANGVHVLLEPQRFQEPRVVLLGLSNGGTSLAVDADVPSARSAVPVQQASGVGDYTALRLRQTLQGTGVSAEPQVSEWGQSVRGIAPTDALETLLQLVYLHITAPRFDELAFGAWRAQQERDLGVGPPTTSAAMEDAWTRLTGLDDPRAVRPSLEGLADVDLERARAFYAARLGDVGDMTFGLVGSFDPDEVRPLVERYLGALPSTGRTEAWRDSGFRLPDGVVAETVPTQLDAGANTRILFHGPIDYDDPAESVRIQALGTALEIRLRRALRGALGEGSYVSVRATAADRPYQRFSLDITFSSDPDATEGMVSTIFEQLAAFREDGPSSEEADRARDAMRATQERNLHNDLWWSNELSGAALRGEPPTDRILGVAELIDAVDAGYIRDAAREYLDEGRYVRLTLSPDPDSVAGGAWLPSQLMQRRADQESRNGYYAKRIEGRSTPQGPEYRASFARFPTAAQARWNWGMTEEAFEARDGELVQQGYTPIWRQDFTYGNGELRIQAVWMRFVDP